MTATDVARFCRLSLVGMALSVTVFGHISAGGPLASPRLPFLLLVALLFHVAVFVHNDLCDLELDRSEPRRAGFPLVTGRVKEWQAWLCVVAATVLSFVIATSGADWWTTAALAFAFAGLFAYNIFGKRLPIPWFIDAVQGVGWGMLALYAAAHAGHVTAASGLLMAYVVAYIVLVNGVHGGIRDLDNDFAHGARTAAIVLGARPSADGPLITPALRLYAWTLQAALVALAFGTIGLADFATVDSWLVVPISALFVVLAGLLLGQGLDMRNSAARRRLAGAAHLAMCFIPAAGIAAPRSIAGAAAGATILVGPMAGNSYLRSALRSALIVALRPRGQARS